MQQTVDALGRLDIVINNAGVMLLGPVVDAPIEDWERMVDVNVKGLLYTRARRAPPPVRRRRGRPAPGRRPREHLASRAASPARAPASTTSRSSASARSARRCARRSRAATSASRSSSRARSAPSSPATTAGDPCRPAASSSTSSAWRPRTSPTRSRYVVTPPPPGRRERDPRPPDRAEALAAGPCCAHATTLRQYDDLASEWWEPRGEFAALHWLARGARPRSSRPPAAEGAVLVDVGLRRRVDRAARRRLATGTWASTSAPRPSR